MQQILGLGFTAVHTFLTGLLDGDLHAKRVMSLANATLGVIRTASLAVHAIGLGLAQARGLNTKHAIKQVDRMLSNDGIDVDAALRHWVPYVVGPRTSIDVAMDWTEFDADCQGHDHAVAAHPPWPRHAADVADGGDRQPQEPSQRV
jgi:hypothetical protein